MISLEDLRSELVGRDLGTGTYDLTRWRAWLLADAIEGEPPTAGVAHPMLAYWIGQGGMGVSLEDFFAWCHATSEDGVMLGTAELELLRPFEIDERFTVTGTVDDVTRKQGSSGTFDIVTFHLDLTASDGVLAGRVVLGFIYPRRGSA